MIIYSGETVLGNRIEMADTFLKKLVGLMGRSDLQEGEGLFLDHCAAIHCFFMKMPIDAVYLSREWKVTGIETIRPWHLGTITKNTSHVLELPAGSVSGKLKIGDQLVRRDGI